MARATFTLDGAAVHDISSFYAELNRVFMANESWKLGESLDALNDLLWGGIGALTDVENPRIVFENWEYIRDALGAEVTREYYLSRLAQPERYNPEHFAAALGDLDAGAGVTYFDLVLEVFAEHPDVELVFG